MAKEYKATVSNKKVRLSQGNIRLSVSEFQSQTKLLHNTNLRIICIDLMQPLNLIWMLRVGY